MNMTGKLRVILSQFAINNSSEQSVYFSSWILQCIKRECSGLDKFSY